MYICLGNQIINRPKDEHKMTEIHQVEVNACMLFASCQFISRHHFANML